MLQLSLKVFEDSLLQSVRENKQMWTHPSHVYPMFDPGFVTLFTIGQGAISRRRSLTRSWE